VSRKFISGEVVGRLPRASQLARFARPTTEAVATFTTFQGVNIIESYAEYALNATVNGENRLFLIYFLKDADGVWRVEAM